jgi:hypothetical protein
MLDAEHKLTQARFRASEKFRLRTLLSHNGPADKISMMHQQIDQDLDQISELYKATTSAQQTAKAAEVQAKKRTQELRDVEVSLQKRSSVLQLKLPFLPPEPVPQGDVPV